MSKAKNTEKGKKKEDRSLCTTNLNEEPSEWLKEFMIFNSENQAMVEEEEVEEQLEGKKHRDRLQTSSGGPCINSSNSDGLPE